MDYSFRVRYIHKANVNDWTKYFAQGDIEQLSTAQKHNRFWLKLLYLRE